MKYDLYCHVAVSSELNETLPCNTRIL